MSQLLRRVRKGTKLVHFTRTNRITEKFDSVENGNHLAFGIAESFGLDW